MQDLNALIEELEVEAACDTPLSPLLRRAAEALTEFAPDTSKVPVKEIIELYNQILGPHLKRAMRLPHARRQAIISRWTEDKEQRSMEWWKKYFERAAASDFLCGRTVNRFRDPWKANIDWLLKPTPMAKVLEGNYDNQRVSLADNDRRMLGFGP